MYSPTREPTSRQSSNRQNMGRQPLWAVSISTSAAAGWGLAVTAFTAVVRGAAAALQEPGPGRPEDGVALVFGVLALALCAWVAIAVAASALAVGLSASATCGNAAATAARRIAPGILREAVAVALGATLLGAGPVVAATTAPGGHLHVTAASSSCDVISTPCSASRGSSVGLKASFDPTWGGLRPASARTPVRTTATTASTAATHLDPGWTPTALSRPAPVSVPVHHREIVPVPGRAGRSGPLVDSDVVVRRGDTLWDIARRHLGPTATDAEIAGAWPGWYASNRSAIGPDPDHLEPGQRLHPPGAATSHAAPTGSPTPTATGGSR